MDYSDRTYAFANIADIDNVDFSQVMETSSATVRKSLDESLFIIKWYTANQPTFITDGSVSLAWSGTHADCLTIVTGSDWTSTEDLEI